jgi:fatty acid desaturase
MSTAAATLANRGILRHSGWDALLVALAAAHGVVVFLLAFSGTRFLEETGFLNAAVSSAILALGLWWNANTIAHNFIHKPFFRARALNCLFSAYLSLVLGLPQSLWRDRHLAHHAGVPWRFRLRRQFPWNCPWSSLCGRPCWPGSRCFS